MPFNKIWSIASPKATAKALSMAGALLVVGVSSPAASAPTVPPRPLSGHCDGTYQLISFDGTFLRVQLTGTCKLTILGSGPHFKDLLVNLSVAPYTVNGGAATFTASNGDELYATETAVHQLSDANGDFACSGGWVFSGGTGRFVNATGAATWSNCAGNSLAMTTSRDVSGDLAFTPGKPTPSAFEFRAVP